MAGYWVKTVIATICSQLETGAVEYMYIILYNPSGKYYSHFINKTSELQRDPLEKLPKVSGKFYLSGRVNWNMYLHGNKGSALRGSGILLSMSLSVSNILSQGLFTCLRVSSRFLQNHLMMSNPRHSSTYCVLFSYGINGILCVTCTLC